MNAPTDLARLLPRLEGKVSAEEWQARVDLAAAYRLVALFRWDDLVFTHITAKIAGTEHFLINPYGLMFDEITASSLIKIDIAGKVLQETKFPINPAGFTIHSAVHAARHDVQCVMHTHTLNGVAVSAQKRGSCRSRSSRSSSSPTSRTTTTKASRCATTRSRGSSPTSASARS